MNSQPEPLNETQASTLPGTQGQDRMLAPPSLRSRYRGLALGAGVVILICGAVVWGWLRFRGAERSVDRSLVTVATVERGSFLRDVAADGVVVATVSPTLYATSGGTVTLKAHAGDPVEKDQVLAVVESTDLQAKVSQEQATQQNLRIDWERSRLEAKQKMLQLENFYRQSEIDQKTAQREVERSRKAYELGSYSELQMLRSEATLEKAQFAYQQAKASYEAQPQQNRFDVDSKKTLYERQQIMVADLQHQVEALQVRAPVTGRVGQVQVADRASVAKDTPLLTVVDLSALQVEVRVPESLARDLAIGMKGDLEGDGHHWTGIVSAISPQVIGGEVVARLRFAERQPEGLRQNQRLSARIFIDRRNDVSMVDRGPFVEQDGGGFVYVVHGSSAERRPVRLGAVSVQKVEIVQGLNVGDQIVISGTDTFNGAQRVILAH